MAHITWRADEALVLRVKRAAAASHRSLNEYLSVVLDAATDPDRAGSESERVRERLLHAGLLAAPVSTQTRPPADAVEAAGLRASRGRCGPTS